MPKVCNMEGVREHGGSGPVELWQDDETGRLVVRAYNEGGYSGTDVDLLDLVEWLRVGPRPGVLLDHEGNTVGFGVDLTGYPAGS